MAQGNETRKSILPIGAPTIGFSGSSYNPAKAMITPAELGIKVGDSMSDVVNSVKGVGFYTDQIGFGVPTTGLTAGMPLRPLGINYFMNTGIPCSNGADMWYYMNGIPEGNAFGKRVGDAMKASGMPLQGLAPGALEAAEKALDPGPLINTLFGASYPECTYVEKVVGDSYGNISDPTTGEDWIGNTKDKHGAYQRDGLHYQKRWVQTSDLDRETWTNKDKKYNPDGTEKFTNYISHSSIIVIGVLCLLAFGIIKR
jgi:hypothetical protein